MYLITSSENIIFPEHDSVSRARQSGYKVSPFHVKDNIKYIFVFFQSLLGTAALQLKLGQYYIIYGTVKN